MRRRRNGGGLIIGLSTSNMMSVGLPGISGAPSTSTGYLYLLDSTGVLYQLDPTTLKTIKTLSLGTSTVSFTTDGTYLYAWAGDYLNKIDQSTLSIVATLNMGGIPTSKYGLTYDGKYIYAGRAFITSTSEKMYSIDPKTLTVVASASNGGYNYAITYDGTYIDGGLGGPA